MAKLVLFLKMDKKLYLHCKLFRMVDLNSEKGENTALPGWLKFKDGIISNPAPGVLHRGIHIRTLDCERQEFVAETKGINTELELGSPTNLIFKGRKLKKLHRCNFK